MDVNEITRHNKISIYGDSISTVNHGEGGYEKKLKESLSLEEIYNFSIGSSGLSSGTPNSMVNIVMKPEMIPKDVDLNLIWHGSNDWYWGTKIGQMGNSDPSTFWGSIDFTINKLRQKNHMARIAWVTPIYRREKPYMCHRVGDGYELQNLNGYTLLDYYKVIELASKRYGFYLIDMRRMANFHRENAQYFLEDYVHPNKHGYKIIHDILYAEIKKLLNS